MTQFPVDKAFLIAGWVGAALWGIYTVLFVAWVYIILHKPKGSLAKPMVIATMILYTLSTVNIGLTLTRLINAFITYRKVIDPILYFIEIPFGPQVGHVLDFIYSINMILGDSLVVWRCWIVWGKNLYVMAFPLLLLLGLITAALASPISTVVPNPSETIGIRFGTSMFVLSFVTNVIVTFLTAGKIWWTARDLGSKTSGQRYQRLLLLVIESGLFMAAVKTIEFVLFRISPNDGLDGDNALYIVFDIMPHLTGIIPTMMVVVVSLGLTNADTTYDHSLSSASSQAGGLKFAANVNLSERSGNTGSRDHSTGMTSDIELRSGKKIGMVA